VFDKRGRIYAQFEYLRKIHYASIGRPYKEPRGPKEEKVRGRPRKFIPGWTSVGTAATEGGKVNIRNSKKYPAPLFPSGPEQAKSIQKWETVIGYLKVELAPNRKNKGDIRRLNIVGENLCG
jgi:hypothetical protein